MFPTCVEPAMIVERVSFGKILVTKLTGVLLHPGMKVLMLLTHKFSLVF